MRLKKICSKLTDQSVSTNPRKISLSSEKLAHDIKKKALFSCHAAVAEFSSVLKSFLVP